MSYDTVAGVYQRVAVPWFTPLANDLIEAVAPRPGERVLDLGTGTGLVAELASSAVKPGGSVVGVDPSRQMLVGGSRTGRFRPVVGMAPGLPFAGAMFDVVTANLVLSHLPDLRAGLADVVRVMRSGSRFGFSAWASPLPKGRGNQRPEADAIVASVRSQCGLDVPPPRDDAVPFEALLYERDRLIEVLVGAGLVDVAARSHRYHRTFAVEEFLSGWGSQGRYLRQLVGHDRWASYVTRASEALRERFTLGIPCENEAWIVTGRSPTRQ